MISRVKCIVYFVFIVPHIIIFCLFRRSDVVTSDLMAFGRYVFNPYRDIVQKQGNASFFLLLKLFVFLIVNEKVYRNVFYLRIGKFKYVLLYIKPLSSLYFITKSSNIGSGLYIQHGFSTIINANKIGNNCYISQQVTIGNNNNLGCPVIGNNVYIACGAKICGPIEIGDNSVIGLNASVVKDVPSNAVIVPSPQMIIRQDGNKVKKLL